MFSLPVRARRSRRWSRRPRERPQAREAQRALAEELTDAGARRGRAAPRWRRPAARAVRPGRRWRTSTRRRWRPRCAELPHAAVPRPSCRRVVDLLAATGLVAEQVARPGGRSRRAAPTSTTPGRGRRRRAGGRRTCCTAGWLVLRRGKRTSRRSRSAALTGRAAPRERVALSRDDPAGRARPACRDLTRAASACVVFAHVARQGANGHRAGGRSRGRPPRSTTRHGASRCGRRVGGSAGPRAGTEPDRRI